LHRCKRRCDGEISTAQRPGTATALERGAEAGDRRREFAPGTIVSNVARRADISSGQIYRWRQEFRATPVAGFTPVLIAPAEGPAANTEDGLTSRAAPAIELEFTGKVRVRIPVSVPPELAAAVVKALSRR
jgi:transposase